MTPGEQADGLAAWSALVARRDKLSARLSFVAALDEDDPDLGAYAARVTASRVRFEVLAEGLAAWLGAPLGEVAGLMLAQEEAA